MSGKRFVIVGPQRSGTTLVHLGVRGHPNVCAANDEIRIRPLFTHGLAQYMISGERFMTPAEERRRVAACFDAVAGVERSEASLAWGLKIASDAYEDVQAFVDCLRTELPEAVVILVEREDLVAQYGSGLRMRATGQAHSWRASTTTAPFKVRIAPRHFARYARNILRIGRALQTLEHTHPVVTVSYERDLLGGDHAVFSRLFAALGVPDMPVSWLRSSKVAPPPESYIDNYAELTARLARMRQAGDVSARDHLLLKVEDAARRLKRIGAAVRQELA